MDKPRIENITTNQTTFGHDDKMIRVSFIGKNADGSPREINNYFNLESAFYLLRGIQAEITQFQIGAEIDNARRASCQEPKTTQTRGASPEGEKRMGVNDADSPRAEKDEEYERQT